MTFQPALRSLNISKGLSSGHNKETVTPSQSQLVADLLLLRLRRRMALCLRDK